MSKKEFLNRLERMRNRSSVASTSATVAALTSDDITEGTTNLYYTETRFDASFSGKNTDNLAEGTNLYFTDERAQDAVGGMVDSTLTYDDATPSLGVADGGIDTTQLADDSVDSDKIDGADAAAIRTLLGLSEMLLADRDYYVDTGSGSDSNDGLSSGAGAFATIQKAIDTASGLFIGPYTVTINVAAGTYSENLVVGGISGTVEIIGDTTTPTNCVISHGTSAGLTASGCVLGQWIIKGFEFNGSSGACIDANGGGMFFDQCKFTTTGGSQLFARSGGVISRDTSAGAANSYEVDGDPNNHITAATQGVVNISNATITVTGTPAWNKQMINAITGGLVNAGGNTITGSATGKRYNATGNGVINTIGGGASYFPGNVAGTTATGGQYL